MRIQSELETELILTRQQLKSEYNRIAKGESTNNHLICHLESREDTLLWVLNNERYLRKDNGR